jgi:hypothetical protein
MSAVPSPVVLSLTRKTLLKPPSATSRMTRYRRSPTVTCHPARYPDQPKDVMNSLRYEGSGTTLAPKHRCVSCRLLTTLDNYADDTVAAVPDRHLVTQLYPDQPMEARYCPLSRRIWEERRSRGRTGLNQPPE